MASASGSLNLFLNAVTINSSGTIPLYTTGSTSGYTYSYNSLPLFLYGEPNSSYLNLFIEGKRDQGSSNTNLNLILEGRGEPVNNNLPLIVWGSSIFEYLSTLSLNTLTVEQLSSLTLDQLNELLLDAGLPDGPTGYTINNSISLYIDGEGQYDDAITANSYLNLYLLAPPGAEDSLDLFIEGRPENNNHVDLYTFGITGFAASGLNLYLHSIGQLNNNVPLYLRGYTVLP